MFLRSDESRVYWDPAPAKLDVVPARVKDVLFPEYDGMTGVHSVRDTEVTDIKSVTTQQEDGDLLELAPEDQEALDRYVVVSERGMGLTSDKTPFGQLIYRMSK